MKLAAATLTAVLLAGSAQAATLFDLSIPTGPTVSPLSFANGTFTSDSGAFYALNYGGANVLCPFNPIAFNCEADFTIDFTGTVTNLIFQSFGHDPGDSVTISAYRNTSVVGSLVVAANQVVDFTSFGGITSLRFDNTGAAAGYGWGNFTGDISAAVPVPASAPLLLAGIGAVVALRRRKSA